MTRQMRYTPILRGKEGEMRALGYLEPRTQGRIRPMLDMPVFGADEMSEGLCKCVNRLAETWGTSLPLLLDMSRYEPAASGPDGRHAVELLFAHARQRRLNAIPVTGPEIDRGPGLRYLLAVRKIIRDQNQGVGLRVSVSDYQSLSQFRIVVDETLSVLGVGPEEVDLYLDAGSIEIRSDKDAEVGKLVASTENALKLADAMGFRGIAFVGSSVPGSVGPKYNARPCRAPRVELEVWKILRKNSELPEISFGDYGVMPPLQNDGGGSRPPSRIRLVTETEYVLYRADADDYLNLRNSVSKSRALREQKDSWGLRSLLGQGGAKIGSAPDWVARDTNTSLETTCGIFAKYSGEPVRLPQIDTRRSGTSVWRQEGLDLPNRQPDDPVAP